MYQLARDGVIRLSDNQFIKDDPMDGDGWFDYQQWLSEGNTPAPEQVDPVQLAEVKSAKLHEINDWADATLGEVTKTYPMHEVVTWDQQNQEARKFKADRFAHTPLLDGICQSRGIDKAEICNRIIAKADAFQVLTGQVIGRRQAMEDRLDKASTVDEVEAISP
ncbi:hypothetical protein [Endozoicomonas ascidiicola]|uniref:hypothetical protein n=1 Tax=Endozoicomonas ascidiicola TaxID=1698521 RepID=UPI0008358833|nr:hypothetical protein [Endozoicomonas ascidiicola]